MVILLAAFLKGMSPSVDTWLKIVALLNSLKFDFTLGDVADVTAAAVELDLGPGLQLAGILGSSTPSTHATAPISSAMREALGDNLKLWVQLLRFLKAHSIGLPSAQVSEIIKSMTGLLKTREDSGILSEAAGILQSLKR
jgi:hypothetical protein